MQHLTDFRQKGCVMFISFSISFSISSHLGALDYKLAW